MYTIIRLDYKNYPSNQRQNSSSIINYDGLTFSVKPAQVIISKKVFVLNVHIKGVFSCSCIS